MATANVRIKRSQASGSGSMPKAMLNADLRFSMLIASKPEVLTDNFPPWDPEKKKQTEKKKKSSQVPRLSKKMHGSQVPLFRFQHESGIPPIWQGAAGKDIPWSQALAPSSHRGP